MIVPAGIAGDHVPKGQRWVVRGLLLELAHPAEEHVARA